MSARLIVCADDLGLHPATSDVILGLMGAWRINAASCIADGAAWPSVAPRLRKRLAADPRLSAGLHLNLSRTPAGALAMAFAPGKTLRSRVRAQITAFQDAIGRAPDFVDGHHHVHLMGPVREALLEELGVARFSGWVRQCRSPWPMASPKAVFLDLMSRRMMVRARRAGIPVNPAFGGIRRFAASEDVLGLWRADLARMTGGGVLMVHPGAADDEIGPARVAEARLLAAGALAGVLDELGLALAVDPGDPWR